MSIELKFAVSIGLILASTIAGYFARKHNWIKEAQAKPFMTAVTIFGYPSVGFLAVWKDAPSISDAWLPMLGFFQAGLQVFLALVIAKKLFRQRDKQGLLGVSCGIGNHGITMVGFVVYLLFGEEGLKLNTIYAMYTFFALPLLSYPVAMAFSDETRSKGFFRLMFDSMRDIRSIGFVACIAGLILSSVDVKRPEFVSDYKIIEYIIYAVIIAAYFSIGLRLQIPHIMKLKKMILSMLAIRHVGGIVIGLLLYLLVQHSPWPMNPLAAKVFLLQASVPMGVMGVAVANMFHMHPRCASAMFVVSSILYLAIGLPLILIICG